MSNSKTYGVIMLEDGPALISLRSNCSISEIEDTEFCRPNGGNTATPVLLFSESFDEVKIITMK